MDKVSNFNDETNLTNDEQYIVYGKLFSMLNSVELMVNVLIESIILSKKLNGNSNKLLLNSIDKIEQLSIKERVAFLVVLINISYPKPEDIEVIAEKLKEFADYYNSKIRDYRDFIAHNPLIFKENANDAIIISARRINDKLNSMSIEEIKKQREQLQPEIEKFSLLCANIQDCYSHKPIREISRT